MALIFDLLLLFFLIVIVFLDMKKGFLRTTVGFARIFIAFAIAFTFSGVLASLIDKNWIYPAVHRAIKDALDVGEPSLSEIPIGLRAAASLGGINLQTIIDTTSDSALSSAIAQPISQVFSAALSFVLLLIGAYLLLKFLVPIFSKAIRTFSPLKAVDTVGGLLFGIFHAFLLGWALSFAAGFLLSLLGMALQETYVIRFFNHVSPIKVIIWIFLR